VCVPDCKPSSLAFLRCCTDAMLAAACERAGRDATEREGVRSRDVAVDRAESAALPLRIFALSTHSPASPPPAVIVYLHGGGFVCGSVASYDSFCRALCAASRCVVVFVEYRRAPDEGRFPDTLQDATLAIRWCAQHRDDLFFGAKRLVVMGDSAGGNLAVASARALRDAEAGDGAKVDALVVFYPVADPNTVRDAARFRWWYSLKREQMRFFWDSYLPRGEEGNPQANLLAAPRDFRGMPRTMLVLTESDPLLREGEELAEALRASGVAVNMRRHADTQHGFALMLDVVPEAAQCMREVAEFVNAGDAAV
jgi:acetyl esterase